MTFHQSPLSQMSLQQEDHGPAVADIGENSGNIPLVMHQGLAVQGPEGIPTHPHVLPMRHSREYPGSPPAAMDLPSYRNSLLSTLNSERWGHHRTVQNMAQELEFHRQEISDLQRGCESWAQAWTDCNDALLRSEADRIRLLRDIMNMSAELHALQEERRQLLQQVGDTTRYGIRT